MARRTRQRSSTPPARPDRREFVATAAALLAALAAGAALPAAAGPLRFSSAKKFSFDALRQRAREMALMPYNPPPQPPGAVLDKIDYDAHGKLHFRTDDALFANGPGRYPITFFAMGRYSRSPVRMHVIDAHGAAREIRYDPDYFDMPADSPARDLGPHAGFAGFRIQESRLGDQTKLDWQHNDWAAFLGASYFRAIGGLYQYGLSARGVAVNVAESGQAEEFPAFTEFWFEAGKDGDDSVILYALLDGPSISGAYRFTLTRTADVLMDVEASLYLRRDIARLGLAPCTSMYWYSETVRPAGEGSVPADWRPEVHDSDGLALWTGAGERIWRPLNDPPRLTVSAFEDKSPHGFGLLQRDRNFDHYQDGVHYERRPDLWVEPLGDWGAGAVQLVEIPTDDEIHDNIVAMWVPAAPAKAGASLDLRYRLHWTADERWITESNGPSPLAQCIATRLGRGGEPGQPPVPHSTKFVVEFLGGPLAALPFGVIPQAVVTASQGTVGPAVVEPVPDGIPGHWRARFDLDTRAVTGPVELRLYLKRDNAALSETWLYQFHPGNA
ncbi:MAG TPA: glucan biosynthesis protein D [Gallionellaceae bacterium]|nr:glucan biosynthesis protein D [Gallionellaceae bacterium]